MFWMVLGGCPHMEELENKMVEFMRPLFGSMAERTIENQKAKLGIGEGDLSHDDYVRVIEAIGDLCKHMAGDAIAGRIQAGLTEILEVGK